MVKLLILAIPVIGIALVIQFFIRPVLSDVGICYTTFETEHTRLASALANRRMSQEFYCENTQQTFLQFNQCFASISDRLFLKEIAFDLTQEHNRLAEQSSIHNQRCGRNQAVRYNKSVLGELFRLTL